VFPWTTLFLVKAVEKKSWRYAALAGLFIFLATLVSVLMLLLLGLWLAFFAATCFLTPRRRLEDWRLLAVAIAIGGVLSLPLLSPLLRAAFVEHNSSFIADPAASFVTDLASPFTPHWVHWYIRGIYFGLLPTALLLAATRHREARLWFLLMGVAFLFAIGPRPTFAGKEVGVVLPWSLWLAPLLRNMYRLNILLSLGLAMAVAYGWLMVAEHVPEDHGWRVVAVALCAGVIFADFVRPSFPHTEFSVPRFYRQVLAEMPDDVAVAIVPLGRQVDKPHLFYQTIHGHRMVNGVVSRANGETLDFIQNNAILRAGFYDLPSASLPADPAPALAELARAGVDYLIIEKGWEFVDAAAWQAALPGPPVYEDGSVLVFATSGDVSMKDNGRSPQVLARCLPRSHCDRGGALISW
jgi:hypothetical protein